MQSYSRLRRSIPGSLTINGFVRKKLGKMREMQDRDGSIRFDQLFTLMFTERNNIMFESSRGYRIRETTYGECHDGIIRLTAGLRRRMRDCPADAVIGLYMDNSREWIEAFWAILLSGFRPLLMNLRLSREILAAALADTGAVCVVTDARHAETPFEVPTLDVRELTDAEDGTDGTARAGSEILLMSSGTSDRVKICAYTADAFRVMIEDSYKIIRDCPQIKKHYKGRLKQLAFLPFYHIFGLVAVYIWFAFFSRTFVLLENMQPETIVNTIRRHQVTHIFAVPMLWDRTYEQAIRTIRERGDRTWAKYLKGMKITAATENVPGLGKLVSRIFFREIRENMFGSSIRFLISGGSEIRPCVLEFMNRIGYHIANGYGMTEIGITSVELSRERRIRNSGSVGEPFSSVGYRIDGDGQLLVSGPGMAKSIRTGREILERDGEWFATGDLAKERDGRYHILGRMDDLVISPSGENLNPTLVEQQLEMKTIRELCLIGVEGQGGIRATLVARPQTPLPKDGVAGVREALKTRLKETGLEGQIGQILLVKEPLIAGDEIKLNRGRIRRRLEEGAYTILTEDAEEETAGELLDQIREIFAATLGKAPADIRDTVDFFTDEGGTSLDYFDMAGRLQDRFGIAFPVEDGKSLNTVRELAAFVERKAGGA